MAGPDVVGARLRSGGAVRRRGAGRPLRVRFLPGAGSFALGKKAAGGVRAAAQAVGRVACIEGRWTKPSSHVERCGRVSRHPSSSDRKSR